MLLTARPSLHSMPETITLTTIAIALLFALCYLLYFVIRAPLVLVVGARSYIPAAQPAVINEVYVDGFSRLFVTHYASWNVYNFRANRNRALRMIASDLGATVALESQGTERLVGILQNARQIHIGYLTMNQLSPTLWSVLVYYHQINFDGGIERDHLTRAITLMTRVITPTPDVPYCLEVVTLTERAVTEEEQVLLPPLRQLTAKSSPLADDWALPPLPMPERLPELPPTPGTTP